MNKLRRKLSTIALCASVLATPIALPVFTTGCAFNQKSEVTAYKTLKVTGDAANTTIDTWLRYAILKERANAKIMDDAKRTDAQAKLSKQEEQVKDAYSKFQSAYSTAIIGARLDPNKLAPDEVAQLCAQLASVVTLFVNQ